MNWCDWVGKELCKRAIELWDSEVQIKNKEDDKP
jgi:hypothetical protein